MEKFDKRLIYDKKFDIKFLQGFSAEFAQHIKNKAFSLAYQYVRDRVTRIKYHWFNSNPKGYALNLIGVRSDETAVNRFNDMLIACYVDKENIQYAWPIKMTTKPGINYLKKPMNSDGAAILVPGQYLDCWEIGEHRGKYEALVQTGKMKVYRDNDKDNQFDYSPDTIQIGWFGINLHRASPMVAIEEVNLYSAGCQVIKDPRDYEQLMRLAWLHHNNFNIKFSYSLLLEKQFV